LSALPRLLFTHTLHNGLACASGVMVIALAGYLLGGYGLAAALSSGALVVSLSDMPAPEGRKPWQLLPALVAGPLLTLLVGASQAHVWWLGVEVAAVGLVAGLLSAWGRLLLPLAFGLVLAVVFAIAFPLPAETSLGRQAASFALGGLLYAGWGTVLARLMATRTRQQVLAGAVDEFANYLRLKAAFHDPDEPLEATFQALIGEHALLADKLQAARDFLLHRVGSGERARLARILIALLESYEHALASQTDRAQLRARYGRHPAMRAMGRHVREAAEDLARIAEAILRGRPLPPLPERAADRAATRDAVLELAAADLADPRHGATAALLRGLAIKLFHALASVDQIARAAGGAAPQAALPDEAALRPFVSNRRIRLQALRPHLTWRSPILRFALRLSLAMTAGFALARNLPYAAHGHWIILTIAVVMRPSFSHTRQRHNDRVVGNLLGCVLAGILLQVVTAPLALLPFLFLATAVAHAFITVQYRVTATAACVMGLLQLHLLMPGGGFALTERMVDTVIGAALGLGFSFIFPSWERHSLPGLLARLRQAAGRYIAVALDPGAPPLVYRLARKQCLDAIAALSEATARMLDEPRSRQHPLAPLHGAVTAAYLLAAQLAALRFLLAYRAADFDPRRRDSLLAQGRRDLLGALECEVSEAEAPEPVSVDAGTEQGRRLDPHLLLQQRQAAAREDALRLACFTRPGA
jgi:uncharacterized membrane protein YccC